jgi:hypothetical protein
MASTGDVVLIYHNEQPAFFAQVQDVLPDHKRDWYHVKLLVLQIPMTEVTWILREEYINGEIFTMDGNNVRIEKVTGCCGESGDRRPSERASTDKDTPTGGRVISLFERKRD